jgi:hypothetical protein
MSTTIDGCLQNYRKLYMSPGPYPFHSYFIGGDLRLRLGDFIDMRDISGSVCNDILENNFLGPRYISVTFKNVNMNCLNTCQEYGWPFHSNYNEIYKFVTNINLNTTFILPRVGNYWTLTIPNAISYYGNSTSPQYDPNCEHLFGPLSVTIKVYKHVTWDGVNVDKWVSVEHTHATTALTAEGSYIFAGSDKIYKMGITDCIGETEVNLSIRDANDHNKTAKLSKWLFAGDYDHVEPYKSTGKIFVYDIQGTFTVGNTLEVYRVGSWSSFGTVSSDPEPMFSDVSGCLGGNYQNMCFFCTQTETRDNPPPYNLLFNPHHIGIGGEVEVLDYIPACFIPKGDHAGQIAMVHNGETYYACLDRTNNKLKVTLPI